MQQHQSQQYKKIYRFPNRNKAEGARPSQYPNIVERVGLSRASIYKRMDAGDFPRPIRLSDRAVGWTEEQISAWESSRPYSLPDR